jgi:hypothetical protein
MGGQLQMLTVHPRKPRVILLSHAHSDAIITRYEASSLQRTV